MVCDCDIKFDTENFLEFKYTLVTNSGMED